MGGAKMAAPATTFRWLLPRSRPLLARPGLAAAATPRPYGVRASDTGELVTHTGQVSTRGPMCCPSAAPGGRRARPTGAAGSALV